MDTPNIILLVLYCSVFLLDLYTTKKLLAHEDEVEGVRQLNRKTWTL